MTHDISPDGEALPLSLTAYDLIVAHQSATRYGFVGGTSNWAAAMLRSLADARAVLAAPQTHQGDVAQAPVEAPAFSTPELVEAFEAGQDALPSVIERETVWCSIQGHHLRTLIHAVAALWAKQEDLAQAQGYAPAAPSVAAPVDALAEECKRLAEDFAARVALDRAPYSSIIGSHIGARDVLHAAIDRLAARGDTSPAACITGEPVAFVWERLGSPSDTYRQLHFQGDNSELPDWTVTPLYAAPAGVPQDSAPLIPSGEQP